MNVGNLVVYFGFGDTKTLQILFCWRGNYGQLVGWVDRVSLLCMVAIWKFGEDCEWGFMLFVITFCIVDVLHMWCTLIFARMA